MDRELVVRAREGDHDAFALIAAASIGRLSAVARLILHSRHLADDAVQDALVDAWRNIRGLRDPDRFDAWLHRLLVRACFDHARRDRKRQVVEIPFIALHEPRTAAVEPELLARDELERGLGQLGADQRAVIVLTYYLDLPLTEVAQILDIPIGTAKSRLNRALSGLRARLEADAREPSATSERFA